MKEKFKDIISQGKEAVKKEYDELTDWNCHGDALQLLCEYFKQYNLVEIMKHINALHDLYGHLPIQLYELREEVWDKIRERYYKEFKNEKVLF